MTLSQYAAQVGGTVRGDPEVSISGVASIDDVEAGSLTFATDERYLRAALASRAAAVLTEPAVAESVESARKPLLIVASARVALATLLAALEAPLGDTAARALATSLDDMGTATLRADIAGMRHETQYTRLFRS